MTAKTKAVKTMANIEAGECRWPIGDPRQEGFHFCADSQVPGRPYCAAHCAVSFEAARAKSPSSSPGLPPYRRAA
jgi:GcrA cell cycle regulator